MSQTLSFYSSSWMRFSLLREDTPPNLYPQPCAIMLSFISSSSGIGGKREGIDAIVLGNGSVTSEVGREFFGSEILVGAISGFWWRRRDLYSHFLLLPLAALK